MGAKDSVVVTTVPNSQVTVISSDPQLNGQKITLPSTAIPFLYLPGGFDIGKLGVPLVMPQLNVGLPFGLEAMLRYVPTIICWRCWKIQLHGIRSPI